MRFLLFSDLHLDAQFAWLAGRPELAVRRRQALRATLVRIVELAQAERVDAVLCGGDLYEHDRFTPDTVAFVASVFERLAPMPVFIAPGNHDWLSPASLYRQADWSPNVHVFTEDRLQPIPLTEGVTLWGAAHRAPANTDGFLDHFQVDRGGLNLALFHGSEQGALGFQESNKAPHAPFQLRQISESGLHHACLGHFHRPRATEQSTYPGNPDPLTFGEDGERGAVLLTLHPDGAATQAWHHVAESRFHDVRIEVSGCRSVYDVHALIAERANELNGFVRATLHGSLDPALDLRPSRLRFVELAEAIVLVRVGDLHPAYDVEALSREATARGQFVRDVLGASDLDTTTRERVLAIGLRALAGRDDLDVPEGTS